MSHSSNTEGTEVLPEVSEDLSGQHTGELSSEIMALHKQHQGELARQEAAFHTEIDSVKTHHQEELKQLAAKLSGTGMATLDVGEGMLGESQRSSRGQRSPELDFVYEDSDSEEYSEGGLPSKEVGLGDSTDVPWEGGSKPDTGDRAVTMGEVTDFPDKEAGKKMEEDAPDQGDTPRGGGSGEDDKRGTKQKAGMILSGMSYDETFEVEFEEDSLSEIDTMSRKTEPSGDVGKRGRWRGLDYDESIEVEEDEEGEEEDSWGSNKSADSLNKIPEMKLMDSYYDKSVDVEEKDSENKVNTGSQKEGIEFEEDEDDGPQDTVRSKPSGSLIDLEAVKSDEGKGMSDESGEAPREGGWKMVMYGSEDEDKDEGEHIQITSSVDPPTRTDIPIVIIESDPQDLPVHDFYASLDDLEATNQGSDKQWIKHLEGRLEEYEDEMEALKEQIKETQANHDDEVEELENRLQEYQEELDNGMKSSESLMEKVRTYEEELSLMKQKHSASEGEALDLKDKVREYEDELTNLRHEAQGYQEDIGKLERQLEANDKELDLLKSNVLGRRDQECQQLQEKLHSCEEELEEMKDNEQSVTNNMAEMERKLKSSLDQNDQLTITVDALEKDNEELKSSVKMYEDEMDNINKRIKIFEQETEELTEKLRLCEQEMEEVKEEAESNETDHLSQIRELRKKVAMQDADIQSLHREAEQVDQQHTKNILHYQQKLKDYEDEIAQRIHSTGTLHEEEEEEEHSKTHHEEHSEEVHAIQEQLVKKHSEDLRSLEEKHLTVLKELEERHQIEVERQDKLRQELEQELEASRLRQGQVSESEAQTITEELFQSELASFSGGPSLREAEVKAVQEEYEERISLLQSEMDTCIQKKVAEKAQQLEDKHEQELDMVRSAVHDYQDEYERLKSELSDSYAKELNDLIEQHDQELENQRLTLYNKHSEEMTKLYNDLRKEYEEKMLEILAESLVKNAQDLAMRTLSKGASLRKSRDEDNKSGHSTADGGTRDASLSPGGEGPGYLEPSFPFVEISDKETLEVEYKREMEKVKAELEGMYSETQQELRTELMEQHRAEMYQMKSDLDNEYRKETERVNAELYSAQEQIENIEVEVELKYKAEIERLKSLCADRESDLLHLHREVEDAMEEQSRMAARHVEELENLKNDLTGQHDEDVEQLKMEYSNLLQQKDALLEIKLDQERETLQMELEIERFKLQEELTRETERIKQELTEEAEKSSLPSGLDELDNETQLIPVVEDVIKPKKAILCGDDSDEEKENVSEVTEVTEDLEEDVDVMSDTFESLTQESSGESLKAELEAATARERSLSFSSGDENPVSISGENVQPFIDGEQPECRTTSKDLLSLSEDEDEVITEREASMSIKKGPSEDPDKDGTDLDKDNTQELWELKKKLGELEALGRREAKEMEEVKIKLQENERVSQDKTQELQDLRERLHESELSNDDKLHEIQEFKDKLREEEALKREQAEEVVELRRRLQESSDKLAELEEGELVDAVLSSVKAFTKQAASSSLTLLSLGTRIYLLSVPMPPPSSP